MVRMPKKITMEDLAVIVKVGFGELDEKVEKVRKEMVTKEELRIFQKEVYGRFDYFEEGHRNIRKEIDLCRHHRALIDARLSSLKSGI